jgi:hypothetical protein
MECQTPSLLWNVRPLIVKEWNSLGIGFPLDWGFRAVPAGGLCSGVKYETPSARLVGISGQFVILSQFVV